MYCYCNEYFWVYLDFQYWYWEVFVVSTIIHVFPLISLQNLVSCWFLDYILLYIIWFFVSRRNWPQYIGALVFFLISVGQSGAMWSLIPQGWSSSVLTISHLLWVWRMVIIFEYTRWIKVKMEAQWKFNRHLKMISSRYDVGNFMTFPIWNWLLHFQHHVHTADLLWDFEPLIWKKM